jgi:hypothetical protein
LIETAPKKLSVLADEQTKVEGDLEGGGVMGKSVRDERP